MELKKDIKSELEKIKQMSGKDRIWYIYEYYKFHIVAVILAFTFYGSRKQPVSPDLYHTAYFRHCQ